MGHYSERNLDLCFGEDSIEKEISAFADEDTLSSFAENEPEKSAVTPPPAQLEQVAEYGAPKEENPSDVDKAAKAAADQADEDARRKAHEEAEAKRKAEWEARQAAKKAAEQEQLDHLAAMSDDEVMAASMKRVSTDTEKLTRRNMKECVAEYIQTKCIEDPSFARKTMHPRKGMIRCFQYISRKAWDYVQDELKANGIQPGPGQQAYGCDVPDDLCYQWAVDYFNDPDAKEDHEDEEKFVPKPYYGRSTSKSKSRTKDKDKKVAAPKKTEEKKTSQNPSGNLGQITFGGFTMPEEKAG